jgi:chromosome segregation ATPase
MTDLNENSTTKTDIAILKKELELLNSVSNKFDTTIDRLTTIANNIDKMLAVHESRLEFQERKLDLIQGRVIDIKNEMSDQLKIYEDIQLSKTNNITERLEKLEKWKWVLVGGGIVLTYLITQFNEIKSFFIR